MRKFINKHLWETAGVLCTLEKGCENMKFIIKHEIKGKIRVHMCYNQISSKEADMIQYALLEQSFITGVKI